MSVEMQAYFEAQSVTNQMNQGALSTQIELNLEKEEAQLRYTIDRFFGTTNGAFKRKIEHVNFDGQTVEMLATDLDRKNVMDRLAELGLLVCGGTVNAIFTNSSVNDLDFYMTDASKKDEIDAFFTECFPDEKLTTLNAITYKRKSERSNKKWMIQLITRFVGDAQTIFDWFDFTITHGAYDFAKRKFVLGARFLPDLAKRRLVYSGTSKYPICAMYRTKKYAARGFELPGSTIMHIALSIVQLKIDNYGQLKEQLMGIDTIYLQKLIEAKSPDAPVNYGEFVFEAFQLIDRISGMTAAEEGEED